MPGYLTQAMVLIETEKWLSDIESTLQGRASAGQTLSEVERTALKLAGGARKYLRYEPSMDRDLPPADMVKLDIGTGISRYAFAGSIGPDFPAASNILALNQRWVHETMHKGSPRRAWEKAGTTEFIIKAIDSIPYVVGTVNLNRDQKFYRIGIAGQPDTSLVAEFKKPMMSYILGHLSSIATHVIVHPFINHLLWSQDNLDHRLLEVEIDAQVAKGYFQRDDLHSGDSWEDYFITDGYGVDVLMELYFDAFKDTYNTVRPSETMCAFPSIEKLKEQFPALEDIFKTYPALKKHLEIYHGYDHLLDSFSGLDKHLLEHRIDETEGLKSFLKDYPCKSPVLSKEFLTDGYYNTTNWAIDEGYDKTPFLFRAFWTVAILAGGIMAVKSVQSTTDDFSTLSETVANIFTLGLLDIERDVSREIKEQNRAVWEEKGFIENGQMWLLAVDKSYSWSGYIFLPFSTLATLIPFWDGIFGKGTDGFSDGSKGKKAFTISNYLYKGGMFGLGEIAPNITEHPLTRSLNLLVGSVMDFLKAIVINKRSEENGVEGKLLDRELYLLQLMILPFYFLSCILVFTFKAMRENDDGTKETGFSGWDFLLGLIFPGIAIFWLVWGDKVFDSRILNDLIATRWPDSDTDFVNEYLPIATDPATGRKALDGNAGKGIPVRLFPNKDDVMKSLDGKKYYPQDEETTTAWIDRPGKDELARKTNSAESTKKDYRLKKLFDRAACFSGLLAMAAVNYDGADKQGKEKARKIFQDWNLDYRTANEWNDLMESIDVTTGEVVAPETEDAKWGLVQAAEQWWKDVKAGQPSKPEIMDRLKEVFGLAGATDGSPGAGIGLSFQYEDGSPMVDAEFEAVFGEQRVRGRTDGAGTATINIPVENAETFRLFLLSYPQRLVPAEGRS